MCSSDGPWLDTPFVGRVSMGVSGFGALVVELGGVLPAGWPPKGAAGGCWVRALGRWPGWFEWAWVWWRLVGLVFGPAVGMARWSLWHGCGGHVLRSSSMVMGSS